MDGRDLVESNPFKGPYHHHHHHNYHHHPSCQPPFPPPSHLVPTNLHPPTPPSTPLQGLLHDLLMRLASIPTPAFTEEEAGLLLSLTPYLSYQGHRGAVALPSSSSPLAPPAKASPSRRDAKRVKRAVNTTARPPLEAGAAAPPVSDYLAAAATAASSSSKVTGVPVGCPMIDLPEPILHRVFSCLTLRDLGSCMETSHALRKAAARSRRWEERVSQSQSTGGGLISICSTSTRRLIHEGKGGLHFLPSLPSLTTSPGSSLLAGPWA